MSPRNPPPSATSPPPTPSAANHPTSLSADGGASIPGKKNSIRSPSGQEVNLNALKRAPPPAAPIVPVVPPSPASSKKDIQQPIRIESQEQKERRLAEERVRGGESEERIKTSETIVKANEDAARCQIEERELCVAEERKSKEEAGHAEEERKVAEERAAWEERERKNEEELTAREEEARKSKEREKEYLRLEEARARREAEEKIQRVWTEQEKVRKHREKEEALRAAEATGTLADATSVVIPEESESEDEASEVWHANIAEESLPSKTASVPSLVTIPTDLPSEFTGLEERIGTTLSSPELPHDRPGARDLQTSHTNNSTTISPSVLATARHIEDINSISYSEGIKNPEDEFDITAQEGNFLYVSSTRDIPKRLSPVVLTRSVGTTSVVKMQSLLSDPYMKSSFASNASRVRLTRPGTRPASFLRTGSSESETPDSSRRQSAFLQHSKYFFKDGNVTFLVCRVGWHIPLIY